ncbi:MAG TPA: hypothetical protein VK395_31840 [Gemmataceae bacterium]|nr:hypothetical protein [Gemmataceae bacterium]
MRLKETCRGTHRFLLSGTCPWCDRPIVTGKYRPKLPASEAGARRWNLPAMLAALGSEDTEMSAWVSRNLFCHGPKPEMGLPVLRKAIQHNHEQVRVLALHALRHHGSSMGKEEAERFELQSQQNPGDAALRVLLLGYYFLAHESAADKSARYQHVLWIVEHAPETAVIAGAEIDLHPSIDGEVYDRARQLWLVQVEVNPTNATILGNAAQFFWGHDGTLSEELYRKAQAVEPQNPQWCTELGRLYSRLARQQTGVTSARTATQAFAEHECAYQMADSEFQQFLFLSDLAVAALEAGEQQKARFYATKLVEEGPQHCACESDDHGNIHYGHLVLGRLALQAGDVEQAKLHLLESGKTAGTPHLSTGAPNMMLAKELLERGERTTIVQYMRLCLGFWDDGGPKAEEWINTIERGALPDFGANLYY